VLAALIAAMIGAHTGVTLSLPKFRLRMVYIEAF
jgi:ABC-type branched-subunit amino acid transport system permease subunit